MPSATTIESGPRSGRQEVVPAVTVLVIAWSAEEPRRAGEVAIIPEDGEAHVLGRGGEDSDLRFFRQRPGSLTPAPPLTEAELSRKQLSLVARDGSIQVTNVGRCELRVNGEPCDRAVVSPGDTIHMRRQLVLLCVRREPLIPAPSHFPRETWGPFGEADTLGILGESPAIWALRERLAFVAKTGTHALIVGESGTGKELVARAIHARSLRAAKPLVARNAVTLPPGLIDAELFGNVKNYPNPGMPDRSGLIGQVDGGTLFLDEIGDLPVELQTHLLRLLDAGGEYHRLGEATTRSSSFVLVGATNRDPALLKHDLLARLTSRVEVAPLSARREDIPPLIRHLMIRAAERSPEVASRFLAQDDEGRAFVRIEPALLEHALQREYPANTRDLEALLWQAMGESTGDTLVLPLGRAGVRAARSPISASLQGEPGEEAIRAALVASKGSVTRAAKALGVSSRYALYRMMKKHGIEGDND